MTEGEAKEIVRAYEALVDAATASVGDVGGDYSNRHLAPSPGGFTLIRQELSVYEDGADLAAVGEAIASPFWLGVSGCRSHRNPADA